MKTIINYILCAFVGAAVSFDITKDYYKNNHRNAAVPIVDTTPKKEKVDTTKMSFGTISIVSSEIVECKLDTIKGILIYHIEDDNSNHGNAYDTGYWVGKCGPLAMPLIDIYFAPGEMKITQEYKNANDKESDPWKIEQYTFSNEGEGKGFYDRNWNKVKAKNVYCLYQIRKPFAP